MNKNIWLVLLGVAVVILAFILLTEPKQYDSHADDIARTKAEAHRIDSITKSSEKKLDSLNALRTSDTWAIDSLKIKVKSSQNALSVNVDQIAKMATELKKYKTLVGVSQDSIDKYYSNCEALADRIIELSASYEQYKRKSDSLQTFIDTRQNNCEAAIAEYRGVYNELKAAYQALQQTHETLEKDYTGIQKSLKSQKIQKKIAAVLAFVALGFAALK